MPNYSAKITGFSACLCDVLHVVCLRTSDRLSRAALGVAEALANGRGSVGEESLVILPL